jgi:hypothetical protein
MREQKMFQPDQGFGQSKWLLWIILAVVCLALSAQFVPHGEFYAALIGRFSVPVAIVSYLVCQIYKKVTRRRD